jgi:hypothetical protein
MKEIVKQLFEAKDYIEFVDDDADILVKNLVLNFKRVLDAVMNKPVLVINQRARNYTPEYLEIQQVDSDDILELADGSMHITGSIDFKEEDDPFRLIINTRNFNIYDMDAYSMDDDEVIMVEKGKAVKSIRVESIKNGQSISTRYKFTFGEKVE